MRFMFFNGSRFFCLIVATLFINCKSMEPAKLPTQKPPHHTADGFENPHHSKMRGFSAVLKWQFGRGPYEPPPVPIADIPPFRPDYAEPDLDRIHKPDSSRIQVTWIGHATFLLQVAGVNILTDPMFSKRCSPVSFVGPRRLSQPGIAFEQLPDIHAVIISHDHYDHLDSETIDRLGTKPAYFVPLKVGDWLREKGIEPAFEGDWWQQAQFRGLTLHCVPAQHFSGRSPFGRNATLWSGWVIATPAGNLYFAGDTGYSPDFKEIGQRFGKMRVAMIPIGAYSPRWFMGPVHVSPPEAVQIHQDVRSENSIGMHWGAFNLADERMAEPPIYLDKALRDAQVNPASFQVLRFGETVTF